MDYDFVTPSDVYDQRLRRLRMLELDHCTAMIILEERPGDPVTTAEIAELERRITHHRNILHKTSEPNPPAEAPEEDMTQVQPG